MKKSVLMSIIVLFCLIFNPNVVRGELDIFQVTGASQFYSVVAKYVLSGSSYKSVIDVATPEGSYTLILGERPDQNIYVHEIVFFGESKDQVILLAADYYFWRSVIFKIDLNTGEILKTELSMMEWYEGYFIDFYNDALYIATHNNSITLENLSPATFLKRWDYQVGKIELMKKFSAGVGLQFGYYYSDYRTGLVYPTVLAKFFSPRNWQLSAYKIDGLLLELAKRVSAPTGADDFHFTVGGSAKDTVIGYALRYYK
jgi:hypothetical protein